MSALEVWSRQGAIQIHVYLYLPLPYDTSNKFSVRSSNGSHVRNAWRDLGDSRGTLGSGNVQRGLPGGCTDFPTCRNVCACSTELTDTNTNHEHSSRTIYNTTRVIITTRTYRSVDRIRVRLEHRITAVDQQLPEFNTSWKVWNSAEVGRKRTKITKVAYIQWRKN